MGISQTKRQQVIDNTISVGATLNVDVRAGEDACNMHGLIADLFIGSNVGVEHNFGKWALVSLPRGETGAPVMTTTALNSEVSNPVFWMLGAWMIVDRGVAHIGGAPRTSRNCASSNRTKLLVENSALSTSAVRIHGTITWFETAK